MKTTIVYGGLIGRAENQALVRELKIPLKKITRIKFESYDRIAMLDTQPGAGNNSLPLDVPCHIVIDHHPRKRGLKSDLVFIDTSYGATATILIEWLLMNEVEISTDLATALAYAIRTETQDLGRETSRCDIDAYLTVYPKANMRKLARIAYPKLPHSYFETLGSALLKAQMFRNLICVHIGDIPIPEIVAETADLMLRHRRTGWVFCTGRYKGSLILSMRSSSTKAKAGKLIKRLVPIRDNAGGHDQFAGGIIHLPTKQEEAIQLLEENLSEEFARLMGYDQPQWRPLLDH